MAPGEPHWTRDGDEHQSLDGGELRDAEPDVEPDVGPDVGEDSEPGTGPSGWLLRGGGGVAVALRSGRRRLRWNQRELARRAGLHQATIARLESGADARFSAVVSALAACGLLVVATPPPGAPPEWG